MFSYFYIKQNLQVKNFKKSFYHFLIPKYLTELKQSHKIGKQFLEWKKMGHGYPVILFNQIIYPIK